MGIAAAVGRVLMSKLARMLPSVSAMIKEAQNLEQAYDYRAMRRDASFFLQARKLEGAFANFSPDRLVTKNRMVETVFDRSVAFRAYGISTLRDMDTGRTWQQWSSMYTNSRGSMNQYQEEFISNYEFDRRSKYYGRIQVVAFKLDTLVHNRKYGYTTYEELSEI
jgi:hypothetical protein